eukprot:GHVT01078888.1.p1 GENE.GHVT01078888.1~~GHVT01078888.1.p1  ORF type:complete len:237 (+),score=51.34 GHVT01078888.1:96-713(+)
MAVAKKTSSSRKLAAKPSRRSGPAIKLTARKNGKPKNKRKLLARPPHIRSSLQAGRILILLSGGHRGKRVVLLGVLPSGLLLVTGPFRVNGVPLRRVNARYVIATSQAVDVANVDVKTILKDELYGKSKTAKKANKKNQAKDKEGIFMDQGESQNKQKLPESAKKQQDAVDKSLLATLSKLPVVTQYLKTKFTLTGLSPPHALKF